MHTSDIGTEYTSNLRTISKNNVYRFMKRHRIKSYNDLLQKSTENIDWYWNAVNSDLNLKWFKEYDKIIESDLKHGIKKTRWFVNGKCNIISNVIDRNVQYNPNKIAYIFENEKGLIRRVSYRELDRQVSLLSVALKSLGVKKGDVIGVYLPMIPEAFFSMLACSKIGAVHTTIFSGFSRNAVYSRIKDTNAKILITSNKMQRRGIDIDLSNSWPASFENSNLTKIITVNTSKPLSDNRIVKYDELIGSINESYCETEIMDSEDPLFILYTSGTTGTPKGTIHVHGGFMMVAAQQSAYTIDMTPNDLLFWYADIGWITGQTWVVYGSPMTGGTAIIYDGALNYPSTHSWCELIEKHSVSIFGIAPTAIRLFMRNSKYINNYNFSSLRILVVTGEPINREAWLWYYNVVGKGVCPIINLSGGTEIGGAILSTSPLNPLKPCSVGRPIPGFDAIVLDESGHETNHGFLVIKKPWPSMTRSLLNDWQRFIETYWSKYENMYYHGDLIDVDSDGYWYIVGRADDIIKVSGHRIGTAEIEDAIMSHSAVSESAVVGIPDNISGQSIQAYVILNRDDANPEIIREEIVQIVENLVAKFARPKFVKFVRDLPRTKTGKLLRRIIRAKVTNSDINLQDLSTIDNPESLNYI